MARMTAARAAVEILKREGVSRAFGVPGAAINPFYAALKASGGIQHALARHVEGASHMAEGYTRTHPGNIGVCVGTSGPAKHRHDHRAVLRLRRLHPDPLHHRAGAHRAPAQGGLPGGRHRRHRRTRHQDGRHRPGTGPGPRRPPAGVPPDALRPPRSGPGRPPARRAARRDRVRPGDLRAAARLQARRHPRAGRQGARHAPGVRAPADRRGRRRHQRRRLGSAHRVRRADRRPRGPHPDGLGHPPRRPPAQRGHGRPPDLAPLRQRDLPGVRLRPRYRQPLGQPPHRRPRRVHRGPHLRPRRHRTHPDRPGLRPGLRHRLRRPRRPGTLRRTRPRAARRRHPARPLRLGRVRPGAPRHPPAPHPLRGHPDQAAAGLRGDEPRLRTGDPVRLHHRPLPDRRRPDAPRLPAPPLDQLRPGQARSAGPSRPRSASPSPTPRRRWSPSPATTTSSS